MPTPRELLRPSGKAVRRERDALPSAPVRRENEPERVVVPRPVRTDSVYRRLMVSHDRVRTRHLGG